MIVLLSHYSLAELNELQAIIETEITRRTARSRQRVIDAIMQSDGVTLRELCRRTMIPFRAAQAIVDVLTSEGHLTMTPTCTSNGRTVTIITLAQ